MGIPDRNYMEKLGFGQRWRDIMTLIWSTTSSCILLNRKVGRLIKHVQVLRLGDPLLPILFILTMDPLHKLLDKATQMGLLHPIGADDMVLFLRPIATDVAHLQQLLHSFGAATGLCKNIQK
jgi:hypothetical protein